MKLLVCLLLCGASYAAEFMAMRGCNDYNWMEQSFGPPRCVFVYVRSFNPDTTKILVTYTFLKENGDFDFDYKVLEPGPLWNTIHFWSPGCKPLTIEVEEVDGNGGSISWDYQDFKESK